MLKKKKINLTVNLCFFIYLFASSIYYFTNNVFNGEFTNGLSGIKESNVHETILVILIMFLISIFITCFKNMFIILLFVGIKIGIKSAKKDKLTDIDLGKHKGYYRDVIKNYSPAVLSFIDDFEINKDKDIAATLLGLKLKKHINITESDIQLLDNINQNDLDENEKYILNNEGNFDTLTFTNLTIKDAIKNGLIETKSDIKKKVIKKGILLVTIFILLQALFSALPNEMYIGNNPAVVLLVIIIAIPIVFSGILYPIFSIIYLLVYVVATKAMPYVRTKKGNEVNEMLEGLKNYIKDFSVLGQRSKDELTLWENYLVYSVLFNQNKTLVQELQNLYK